MKRRIEEKTSRTAEMICSLRAASYYEENPCYRSSDHVATLLIPWFVRYMSKIYILRKIFITKFAPKGVYEYVIARTKYIDHIFSEAVDQGFEQVLIFGAGFDTRSIRFLRSDSTVKVFEVDAEATQKAKLGRLHEVGVPIPNNTTYMAIDFNKEDPMECLIANGFQHGKRCLFILEGLLMYLDDDAVDKTFHLMHDLSGEGSRVVFDYIYSSVLKHEGRYYGEFELQKNVIDAGEPWTFGFEEGKVGRYLLDHGFNIEEEYNTGILEKRYFTSYDGTLLGRVNGTHSIVLAKPI
jgi:methyltransferase (TIGR00027 family)